MKITVTVANAKIAERGRGGRVHGDVAMVLCGGAATTTTTIEMPEKPRYLKGSPQGELSPLELFTSCQAMHRLGQSSHPLVCLSACLFVVIVLVLTYTCVSLHLYTCVRVCAHTQIQGRQVKRDRWTSTLLPTSPPTSLLSSNLKAPL